MANVTRSALSSVSSLNFPDNTSQLISPADLRDWITDGIDSFVTQKDVSTFENAFYECQGSTIVASATTDLGLATGNFVHISGTTTITSFGTLPAGARFVLCFDNTANITASASIIIPGTSSGNTKTAVAGDCCMIISEGSGNWRIVGYFVAGGAGAGTVTSVSGTGSVNGITLSGTVTGSGNLTLGGSLSGVDLTSQVTGVLPVANGGSGTTTPSLVAGTNVTISGSWPNQTINASGGGGGTPGGSDTQIQYNNGTTAFGGVSDLTWDDVNNVLTINTPRIGQSVGNGHLHMHTINTSPPSGVTDYITLYADKSPKQIGARFETDAFTSALQFGATTDRTYTLPDATGNVVLDSATQTLTNKTLSTPTIDGVATFGNGASAGEIRIKEGSGSGSDYVAITSPTTLAGNYTLTLPVDDGASGQVLQTDGTGILSWVNNGQSLTSKYVSTTTPTVYPANTALGVFVSLLIPANTFTSGSIFKIVHRATKTGAGNSALRIAFNTTNSVVTGSIQYITASANITGQPGTVARHVSIYTTGGTTTTSFFNSGVSAWQTANSNDIQGNTVTSTNTSIDWSVDQYCIITASTAAGDTFTNVFLSVSPA